MHPRHHEVMPYQAHYASVDTPQYQTRYPGGMAGDGGARGVAR
jgi:hypothetical protein